MNDDSPVFPATHSTLSTKALLSEVMPDYDVGEPVECKLLHRGLNDTYLVRTTLDRFILRVYRTGWRTTADILYELDVLDHLRRKGVSVAVPIPRKDGGFIRELRALEGFRPVVLFTYARGRMFYHEDEYSYRFGAGVAAIHEATDDFASEHARFGLDLEHLIDRPLATIGPLLEHRPEDWAYLRRVGDRLRERVASFRVEGLEWGFCHGDFHGANAHVDEDQTITHFDFDCCGPGWRAYDVAVFPWSRRLSGKDDQGWEAFLKGYTERRRLSDVDLGAVPVFVAIRHIWLLGLHTANGQDWGFGWIDDRYFDRALKFLREWESERLGGDVADQVTS